MRNRTKRSCLALILCAMLIFQVIGLTEDCPVVVAADVPDIIQEAVLTDSEVPSGGVREMKLYRVDEETAAEVPSYEEGISRYSRSLTIFQKGTGTYGFSCLSESQQQYYSLLKTSLTIFESSEDAVFEEVRYGDGTVQYTPFKADFSKFGLGTDEAIQTWVAFSADCPWLFWVDGIAYSNRELMPIVQSDYEKDLSAVREMYGVIEEKVLDYLDVAAEAHGTYEKVRAVYDYLINEINYAYKSDGRTPETEDWAHSMVGVFDGTHRSAVCEGYAKTFSFIMNLLGVPNVYIVGKAEGAHAWNAVSFDGGETYYYVDATWDDTNGKDKSLPENQYVYFAMPKTLFEKRHTPDTGEGTGLSWQYEMPEFGDDMAYTYFVRYAAYGTSETLKDANSIKEFLKTARVLAPGESCLMMLPDTTALRNVASELGVYGYSYSMAKEYNMVLYSHPAEQFAVKQPVETISLSETELAADVKEDTELVITISSVTENSDDYITFYSTNEKVAVVKTAYVKAEEGERVRIAVRGKGTADIYAKACAGRAEDFCKITVRGDDPEPTATPEATGKPTPEPGEKPEVTAAPGETEKPTAAPGEKPEVTVKPGETEKPTAAPDEKPEVTATPEATGKPTPEPGEKPEVTATPEATGKPTPAPGEKPEVTVKPGETEKPTAAPDENKANVVKKGDGFTVGNLKFKVTKLNGKKGEVSVTGVKSKKASSIVIPNKVSKNGISFTIVSIQKNAFKGCKKAKKLKISSTSMKSITKKSMNGLSRKIKITVPKSKAAQYKKMLKKCNFANVK